MGDGFLAAVRAAPADDLPRLAYADYLDERGDPRGEFVRVQCALARLDEFDPRRDELEERERALLEGHRDEWLTPAFDGLIDARFRRGFVDGVAFRAERFLEVAPKLLAAWPVRDVTLLGECANVDLRYCSDLECVERLALGRDEWLFFTLLSLSLNPSLTGLRELGLNACGLRANDLSFFLAEDRFAGLTHLDIGNNPIPPDDLARRLAESTTLTNLRSLSLPSLHINADALARLTRARPLLEVRDLDLSDNPLGPAGVVELGRALAPRRLDRLHLSRCQIERNGLEALTRSPLVIELRSLDLSQNPLYDGTAAHIAASPRLTNLESLNLAGCGFSARDAPRLAAGDHLAALRSLDLTGCDLGPDAGPALGGDVPWPTLCWLGLGQTRFGDAGVAALLRSPGRDRWARLSLFGNGLTDAALHALAAVPLPAVRHLNLGRNRFTAAGVAALLAAPWLDGLSSLGLRQVPGVRDAALAPLRERLGRRLVV